MKNLWQLYSADKCEQHFDYMIFFYFILPFYSIHSATRHASFTTVLHLACPVCRILHYEKKIIFISFKLYRPAGLYTIWLSACLAFYLMFLCEVSMQEVLFIYPWRNIFIYGYQKGLSVKKIVYIPATSGAVIDLWVYARQLIDRTQNLRRSLTSDSFYVTRPSPPN